MKITLQSINKNNYEVCMNLKVLPSQSSFVATNAYSLLQAAYEDGLYPLAIYDKDKMIGFILYDYDQEIPGWSMSRFMIDANEQHKGYGKVALNTFITYFKEKYPEVNTLYTSAEVENEVAIRIYEQIGFKKLNVFTYEHNHVTYREVRMQLKLNNT